MKLLKLRFFYFVCLLCTLSAWAQDTTVSGKVTDENGMPVPGASVYEKGNQTSGTMSDIDGNYQITVGPNATLVFSYIGYAAQEIAVNGQTTVNVSMAPGSEELEEVVVVGYGTQKKSVVTGAISQVKAEQLENLPLTRIEQSLQGRTSGVLIAANAGQPGSSATVRVRGVTSFNADSNNPLWVVDGIIVDNGGIGFLNQADIASIEVLKDAASQAIYGARAGAGVILITTKKGKAGKLQVNYNGFSGVQKAARKLDLLNAQQYATLRNEAYANGYTTGNFQLPFPNASELGRGTDWQDIIFDDSAQRSQHELSLSGGNDKSTFYMSFGLVEQEGIVMPEISSYTRKNIRLNSEHKVNSWLTIGQTVGFSREKNIGIGNTNNEYGGPLASAVNLDPTTPAVVTDLATQPNAGEYTSTNYAVRDENGNYYGISPNVGQEMTNPLAYAKVREGNYGWADNFVGNAFVEIKPIEGLRIRSTVGGKMAYWGSESFTPISYLNANNNTIRNSMYRETRKGFGWNIENTISYAKLIGAHNFSVLLGQAAYVDDISSGHGTTYQNLPVNTAAEASFNWPVAPEDQIGWASTGNEHVVTSLFARVTYDYKEKYLFNGIIRRDGSSRFGDNNKYGVFPSFSAGWVLTKEDFWHDTKVLNQFKLRGGYGVTGNDNIGNFRYLSLVGGGRNYTIGNQGSVVVGNSPDAPANPDLKWEETAMTNIGFDATIFQDFNLTAEWYRKKTTGILQGVRLPGYVGATGEPAGNVADMENTGFEFELGYNKKIGDLNLSVNGNFSTLKNKVLSVGPDRQFNSGPGIQSAGPITRSEVGHSINEFYGYVTDGIFQNQAQIDAYTGTDGGLIQPLATPGDFKFKDLNGDGMINDLDRKFIGSPLPDYTFGITLNLDYKGFDLMAFGQGVAGNQIFQATRRLDIPTANWQTNALNRWTGEGTSNTYPKLSSGDPNGNFSKPSSFYLQDGDYFRLKILQVGYSLPQNVIETIGLSKFRVYLQSENLVTFTKYTGFDPEIGGDVMGIDRGYYPQAQSFMLGCNLQF